MLLLFPPWLSVLIHRPLLIAHLSAVGEKDYTYWTIFKTQIKRLSSEENSNAGFGGPLLSRLVQVSLSWGWPLGAELWFASLLLPDQCSPEKRAELPRMMLVPFVDKVPHELTEGPSPGSEPFSPGQEDAESESRSHMHILPGYGLFKYRPSPALRKSSAPLANALLSFPSPHCLYNSVSSRLAKGLCNCPGAGGRGWFYSQERHSFPGGLLIPSLSGRERRGWGR